MISCCGDFEAFCTMSSNDESKRDFLFVCNSHNIYFLLVQVDPYFDIELTNGMIFSAIISGLQKIGFTEKRLQIV